MRNKLILKIIPLLSLVALIYGLSQAYRVYYLEYPGYFKLQNGHIGGLLHPSAEEFLQYGDKVIKEDLQQQMHLTIERDSTALTVETPIKRLKGTYYFLFVLLPLILSLLYFFTALFFLFTHYSFPAPHKLSAFLFTVSIYLSLLFEFHSGGILSPLFLASFILAAILLYKLSTEKFIGTLVTITGTLIGFFYIIGFTQKWIGWPWLEKAALAYACGAYVLWLFKLRQIQKHSTQSISSTFAHLAFWGVLLSFIFPLISLTLTYLSTHNFSFHWVIPFCALLPLSLLLLSLLAALQDTQRRLHEAEKMALVGQLFKRMSHEIYNPLNFILANIENLKDYLLYLKNKPSSQKYKDKLSEAEVFDESLQILNEMQNGAERIEKVVLELKEKSDA